MRHVKPFVMAVVLALVAAVSWAQAPADLLEKAIYAEESQGDLAAAIRIYEQIAASAQAARVTVANALYRLGMCYLKSGRKDDAVATFSRLRKEYPEQKELLAKIPPVAAALPLLPAPWGRQETLVFRLKMEGTAGGGVMILRLENTERGGKPICHLETFRAGVLYTSIDVDADSFRPLSGRSENKYTGGHSEVTYFPGRIELVQVEKGETKKHQLPTTGLVFDNEEAIQLIRRLPLAEGYSLSFPVLAVGTPILPEIKIEVAGRESVTVPAGTFEAFKVNLGIYLEGRKVDDQKLWYSTDSHRYPVKMGGMAFLELAEVQGDGAAAQLQDAATGVSLGAPGGWLLAKAGRRSDELEVVILAPEMKASGALYVQPLTTLSVVKTAQQMAQDHVEWGQKKYNVYTVRGGAPQSCQIAGQPAMKILADFTQPLTGKSMVEYRTFVAHKGRRVSFWFEAEKAQLDALLPALDQIAASLRLE